MKTNKFQEETNQNAEVVTVKGGRPASLTDESLLELGRMWIAGSFSQVIDFHKTMLGFTATFSTLMASSFGLILGTSNQTFDVIQRLFIVIPILFMLCSSMIFAIGYYPQTINFSLNSLEAINDAREKVTRHRKRLAFVGIAFFLLSIISLLLGVLFFNI